MDVAKYIGLFLLKNNFVYIHGLGNLELRKKRASYTGETLHPASYEVTLSTGGSIDDNLANFIANNEQISISKASNALREFSTEARAALQEGKSVEIPAIGKFVETKGKVAFETNPHFQYAPPSIPSIKIATRQNEPVFGSGITQQQQLQQRPAPQPYESAPPPQEMYEEQSKSSINWPRVVIAVGVLILLAVGGYFLVSKMAGDNKQQKDIVLPPGPVEEQQQPTVAEPMPQDTTITADEVRLGGVDVKLHAYTKESLAKARAREKQLKQMGYAVEIEQGTDSMYYILLPVENISSADTATLVDSLDKLNPGRVLIIRTY